MYALSGLLAAVVGGSALGTGLVRRYALWRSVLDIPNRRSSHVTPTPRGGGVVIALSWLIGIGALGLTGALAFPAAVGLGGGGLAIAVLGWIDDHRGLRARERLSVQFLAAGWVVVWLGGLPVLNMGGLTLPLGALGSLLAIVGIVWLTNLYNFMDGIDGLASSEAVVVGLISGLLLWLSGATGLAVGAWILAASASGFLLWNLPPARIFMGDVGSGLLGFAFGAIALAAERISPVPGVVLLIPLMVFICDATFTLFRRLLNGERVYEAHRSHVYQRLVQRGWTHGQVTALVTGINAGLSALAFLAWSRPALLPAVLGTALGGLIAVAAMVLSGGSQAPSGRHPA